MKRTKLLFYVSNGESR